jgi:hypothetical protein
MERVSILVTSAMAFATVLAIDFAYVTLIRIENQEARIRLRTSRSSWPDTSPRWRC